MTSSAAAKAYFAKTDYYATCPGDWLGKGAEMLGLKGDSNQMHFWSLADNLHPQTGEQLTTYTRDGRRVGMDMTFNAVKSVSLARELAGAGNEGDPRIEQAHREAVKYTVELLEQDMQARVRIGGKSHRKLDNRTTGNLVAYRVTHRDTRINPDDGMPDPSLHDHVFVFNATYDQIEQKWKAAEMGQIKHDAPFYEAVYHNRLATNLKALGYGIERREKAFELAGVSKDLREKFSRRTKYINEVAAKLGIEKPESKAKLGATTRLGKTAEVADDLNGYYVSRLTQEEKQQLATLEGRPSWNASTEQAVGYALGHEFERKSVVDERRLYESAIRNGIGCVTPEGVQAEANRQGLLTKNREATTKDVLAEERRVIAFARDGRGACGRMGRGPDATPALLFALEAPERRGDQSSSESARGAGLLSPPPRPLNGATTSLKQQAAFAQDIDVPSKLSPQQAAVARHVLTSRDRVILIRGAAGTGKTHTMKHTIARINRPVVVLAPSADASRGVLRKEGFAEADTVSRFLTDDLFQQKAKNGVIWIDEAGMLGIRQMRQVFDKAEELGARVVLQGDRKQHGSVERGATLRVLEQFAGLPVAELTDIRRQRGNYKQAVAALSEGKITEGFDTLNELGWVRHTDGNQPLVDDYLAARDAGKEALAIAPTHVEAAEVTAAIRDGLKARGELGEEKSVQTLVPLHWTEAERGDRERYAGTEVLQFHRNGGSFKAGDRVIMADLKKSDRLGKASTYGVYAPTEITLAAGDRIRISANGWTADKAHRLDNGAQYQVAGFEKDGKIRLTNGWFIAPEFKHLTHGYVTTSHASQGKTVDRVLIAMGHESLPAINREQFYVSVSRGKEQATIYTNVTPVALRDAIERADSRKSATELFGTTQKREWMRRHMQRAKEVYRALRQRAMTREGIGEARAKGRARQG